MTSRQLEGNNRTSTNPIHECYEDAKEKDITVFAVLGDGRCVARTNAKFDDPRGGVSTRCGRNGTGGGKDVMEVYIINGEIYRIVI